MMLPLFLAALILSWLFLPESMRLQWLFAATATALILVMNSLVQNTRTTDRFSKNANLGDEE